MEAGRELRLRVRGIQYLPRTAEEGGAQGRTDSPVPEGHAIEPAVTVQEVAASYFYRRDAHYLFYEEQPEGFEQALRTRVKRRGNILEICRQGPLGSSMIFEPGKTYRTEYVTPFGAVMLDVVTRAVEIQAFGEPSDNRAGEVPADDGQVWQDVKIRYALENQGESLGEYELYIEKI